MFLFLKFSFILVIFSWVNLNLKKTKLKKTKEIIDAKLQKVKDKKITDKFKDNLKAEQRKFFNKRLVKGVDFVEPVHKAPFDISEDHLMVMNNEDRAYLDKRLDEERMRSLSPNTLWRIEEERFIPYLNNFLKDRI